MGRPSNRSRLNDTGALVSSPRDGGESHSVSTRKIDNGYIVSQSRTDPRTGEYSYTEQFTDKQPKITPAKVAGGPSPDAGNSLADTVKYMNKGS